MTINDISHGLMKITTQINGLYLKELKIRRDFSKNEHDLRQSYQSRIVDDCVLQSYFTEHDKLNADRKTLIDEVYASLTPLQTTLENLKRESACRDAYDKLVWGNVGSLLSKSLEDLQNGFDLDTLVLVEDIPAIKSV